MKDTLQQVLRESQNKIQKFEEQIKRFEDDPMILVTEMFADNDLLLPILIQRYGDEVLLQAQEYWYNLFFPKFKNYLGVDEISFSYDQTVYPAPINIHLGEDVIAILDIVSHQFEPVELVLVVEAKERIKEISKELEEIENKLKEKEPALKNPLVLGGANPIKLLDISIRQKKYKKDIRDDVHALQEQFFELDRERIKLQSSIEQMKHVNLEREYILERIERRIRKLPGYIEVSEESFNSLEDFEEIEGLERGFSMDGEQHSYK